MQSMVIEEMIPNDVSQCLFIALDDDGNYIRYYRFKHDLPDKPY